MKTFFIANWKIYLSHQQEINFIKKNLNELIELSKERNIILSPSFTSLFQIHELLKVSNINLAAQNCSTLESGALTGEVSADSIKESGCNFCIVGHSERRKFFNETNEIIERKIKLLLEKNITPILCIGETLQEYENNKTSQVLENQLSLIIKINKIEKIIIAYEPVWSIGTGNIPKIDEIDQIVRITKQIIKKDIPILYGGSVNSKNILEFKKSTEISGFLIGKASTDFQEFKKIVKSY